MVLLRLCRRERLPPPRRQLLLPVHDPETGELLDRSLATWFPAPYSYTGEDTAELSTHGGSLVPRLILDAALAAGARTARPGEFTRRAYLNGKLDLLQAEAVLDLIDGNSRALHRAALFQLERGLSRRVAELREGVIGVEAMTVYAIDFPEEDEPPVPAGRISEQARRVAGEIDRLLATAPEGEALRAGALAVLAGRPNSGKSSLFNALLGSERAIVTEIPGTTRDALEAGITIEGYPFRLVDTAGLRQTGELVEGKGIEVARRFLEAADVILFCAERGRELDGEELDFLRGRGSKTVLVRTKSDLQPAGAAGSGPEEVPVSAHRGDGLERLRARLLELAFSGALAEPGEEPLLTRCRHARALRAARVQLDGFVGDLEAGVPMEFAATRLRDAVAELEQVVGVVTRDDVLERLFGEFCVGK